MPESLGQPSGGGSSAVASVSPGQGAGGFSSRALVFGAADGSLTNSATAPHWDSTNDFLGIGTTAPIGPLQVISGGVSMLSLTTGLLAGVGIAAPAARWHVQTTVNGNAFQVTATTAGTQPAFNIQSTGATSKIGFWTTVGSTQASSYTTGSASTGRVLPSTITTIAGSMAATEREAFNLMAQVLQTLIKKDFAGYGLTR